LLQHFKGWFIQTAAPAFDMARATLMDFRVHQRHGTSFVYVLPISDTKALVEYTLFTAQTLKAEQYDIELRDYTHRYLGLKDFTIVEDEFGIIPMTSARFQFFEKGMYNIGIAGGQTKASTGYTFQFIQKQSHAIVDCLIRKRSLSLLSSSSRRFHFYDKVLLKLLERGELSGSEIFTRLFQKNGASGIFKFLDNETSVVEELKLISTLQTLPFLKAAMRIMKV
jgi:lycopene beta-cyclase